MWTAALVFLVGIAFITVLRQMFRGWFGKAGPAPQPVIIVSPGGPSLWQRLASNVVGIALMVAAAVLLLRATATGSPGAPVTDYSSVPFNTGATASTSAPHTATTGSAPNAAATGKGGHR